MFADNPYPEVIKSLADYFKAADLPYNTLFLSIKDFRALVAGSRCARDIEPAQPLTLQLHGLHIWPARFVDPGQEPVWATRVYH